MFKRKAEENLENWKNNPSHKPLVIRGARQTGKTTLIRKFGAGFKNFVELNLEKDPARNIFNEITDISTIIQNIEAVANQKIIAGETLLFLDEIQNSINAIKLLRYFYEENPQLHVISAGSLLEVRMKKEGWSFPVGRVEFLYLYPVNFEEFLLALNEKILIEQLKTFKLGQTISPSMHNKLIDLVADYMVVGGMPEAVNEYLSNRSFIAVRQRQESLVSSFKEDFAKYSSHSETEYLKLLWDKIPFEIGKRINYSKLAGINARTRNVLNAFDILHEAMLAERIFPTIVATPPLTKKNKSAPKIIFLDIGLCTKSLNLRRDQLKEKLINPLFGGALLEAFVGQELLALDSHNRSALYFWIREEKGASSELDFVWPIGIDLAPIEVKSGSQGSLKSLHQFLYRSQNKVGIRVYNETPAFNENTVSLPNSATLKYALLSIPPYLVFRLVDLYNEANKI